MKFFRDYSLSIILFAIMALFLALQGVANWHEFAQNALEHSQEPGLQDFVWFFVGRWSENVQSEFMQLFAFVVLSTYFIHRHSPQSRDGDDEMQAKLDRIERLLRDKSG
jgi:hypothetical protein